MRRSLLSTLIIFSTCIASTHAIANDKNKGIPYKLEGEKEWKALENNSRSMSENVLSKLYDMHGTKGQDTFNYDYLIKRPMKLGELVDFKHPYLDRHVSQLTPSQMDEIRDSVRSDQGKKARYNAILNVAMKYGMESGLYKTTQDFLDFLREDESHLMQSFNYESMMLGGGKIRPAVIDKIGYSERVEDRRTVRKKKARYEIIRQAQVVLKAPTYMDFFKNLTAPRPKAPQIYLMPVTDLEREAWSKGIINGWAEGVRYANEIIEYDVQELFRDFIGTNRYLMMSDANLVTKPTFKETTVGTNAEGNSMNVGESVFEITSLPQFNDNELGWIALPEVEDIFSILTQEEVDRLTKEFIESAR